MRNLASYVMRSRNRAIVAALLLSFVPFMSWLSDAIVALVTLRQGPKEGGLVLLWVILPSVVVAVLWYPALWFYNVLGGTFAVYGLALVLRSSNSWALVLQSSTIVGIIAVAILHLCLPEFGTAWFKGLQVYLKWLSVQFNLPLSNGIASAELAAPLLKIAIGIQIALLLLSNLFSLCFARWWQSILYNPQGLAVELRDLRLGRSSVIGLGLAAALSLAGIGLAIDSMPVIILPFLLASLSLCHYWVAVKQGSKLWLIILYSLLLLFFPYMAVMLVVVAIMDVGINIRHRVRIK